MFMQGDAGYSAFKRAVHLWAVQAKSVLIWSGSAAGGGVAAVGMAAGGLSVGSLAAGGAAGVGMAVWRSRRPWEASRWLQGALAEKRTGRVLRPLEREGWGVLHDQRVNKSRANWDHIAVHPSGAYLVYIDTKAWHAAGALIRVDKGRLMYGPWNQGNKIDTINWEADRLQEVTGLPVRRIVAVDRGRVAGGALDFRGTWVVGSASLADFLRGLSATAPHDPSRVRQVMRNIGRQIEPAR